MKRGIILLFLWVQSAAAAVTGNVVLMNPGGSVKKADNAGAVVWLQAVGPRDPASFLV